jgi:hypothetical protein
MADKDNEFAIRFDVIKSNKTYKNTKKGREEMAEIEFFAGLHTYNGKVVIPSSMVFRNILESARKETKGKQVEAGVVVCADPIYLKFKDDDKTIEDLFKLGYYDQRLVCIKGAGGKSTIMRTRPRFDEWSCRVKIYYDDTMFNDEDKFTKIVERGGRIGLGDYRQLFGKFLVERPVKRERKAKKKAKK